MRSLPLWKFILIIRLAACVGGFSAWILCSSVAFGESPELLPNLQQVTSTIFSGGEPANEEAFEKLAKLGIKTLISVDGVKPDIDAAKRHGIRYVHIPIGYDGVPAEAGLALTRVAIQSAMPVYVHCHHGHHRASAAASVLAIAGGSMDHSQAAEFMKRAGTGTEYKGLWRDVAAFKPPVPGTPLPELLESAKLEGMQEIMGRLDRNFDRLQELVTGSPASGTNQALEASRQEATLVLEAFKECLRLKNQEAGMVKLMRETEVKTQEWVLLLAPEKFALARDGLVSLRNHCTECHHRFRN